LPPASLRISYFIKKAGDVIIVVDLDKIFNESTMKVSIAVPGLATATNGLFSELEVKLFSSEKLAYFQEATQEAQKLKEGTDKDKKLSDIMTELISEALDFPLDKTRKFIPLVLQNTITESIMKVNTDISELEKVKDTKPFQRKT
jgi:hypothetical protein